MVETSEMKSSTPEFAKILFKLQVVCKAYRECFLEINLFIPDHVGQSTRPLVEVQAIGDDKCALNSQTMSLNFPSTSNVDKMVLAAKPSW